MPSIFKYATAALAAVAPLASAQTFSKCNPMEKTCPPNEGLAQANADFDLTQSSGLDKWSTTAGKVTTGSNGAEFTIAKKGDAPTIQSDFYIWYGEVSVTMKAAPGTGIVSSIVLESDDLDEVDWEALGGNTGAIETNYFGKGDTSSYDRDTWPAVSNPQGEFHTYKVDWQKEYIKWYIDGNLVRTLNKADAQGGTRFPQTPMNIRIGIWAGGDSSNGQGTIEWAGGQTDYSAAPFSMYIKDVKVVNANPAKSYTWSDKSGSSDSIKTGGAISGSQTRDTTTTSAASSSTETTEASTTEASTTEASTTEGSTTDATTTAGDATKTNTATTLTTATQSSSTGKTTAGSSTGSSGSGSSSAAGSGSAAATSGGASSTSTAGSGSGSSSGSGSGASGSGSVSGSGSATGSSATPTQTFNAAASVAVNYMGPLSLLALVSAFIQM